MRRQFLKVAKRRKSVAPGESRGKEQEMTEP